MQGKASATLIFYLQKSFKIDENTCKSSSLCHSNFSSVPFDLLKNHADSREKKKIKFIILLKLAPNFRNNFFEEWKIKQEQFHENC